MSFFASPVFRRGAAALVAVVALAAAGFIGWRAWGPQPSGDTGSGSPAPGKPAATKQADSTPAALTAASTAPASPATTVAAAPPTTPAASPVPPSATTRTAEPPTRQFMKGFNYAAYNKDVFNTTDSDTSLVRLAATGTNWLSIVPVGYQKTWRSNEIYAMPRGTASDQSIVHLIDMAERHGMQVMLRPFVDSEDGTWRAWYEPTDRAAWFRSYTAFVVRYAKLAQRHDVPVFCVGSEYTSSEKYSEDWRRVIAAVRAVYKGKLTYGADYHDITGKKGGPQGGKLLKGGYHNVKFWDALDYVGIDAYFPLTDKTNPTVAEMEAGWRRWLGEMERVSKATGRPIMITELMYLAADGANSNPGAYRYEKKLDLQEQADAYEATLRVIPQQDFIAGLFWWRWDNPSTSDWGGGPTNSNCTPKGKPAEKVLTDWWGRIP